MKLRHLWPYTKLVPQKFNQPMVTVKIGGGCFCKSRKEIVADPGLLAAIVEWLVHLWHDGNINLVVVVSAPGGKTDHLIAELKKKKRNLAPAAYAKAVCQGETDMARQLAEAINEYCQQKGLESSNKSPTKAFDAKAMGMVADPNTRAIIKIKNWNKIVGWTQNDRRGIAVCAGFQALSSNGGTLIDLGRGGSDASAVALAVATNCQLCIILKDIPQVVAAPPTLVPQAKGFEFISYPLMYQMARAGSKVLMARAVALAQNYNLPLLITYCPGFPGYDGTKVGTLIWRQPIKPKALEETQNEMSLGLGVDPDISGFTLRGIPNQPGMLSTIFSTLPKVIIVDSAQGLGQPPSVSFTVSTAVADEVARCLSTITQPNWSWVRQDGLAALTLIGAGALLDGPGYLLRASKSLAVAGVNIEMLTTSHNAITCVVHQTQLPNAAQTMAAEFDLLNK